MPKKAQHNSDWLSAPIVRITPGPDANSVPKVGMTQTCRWCKQDVTFDGAEWRHRHDGTPHCSDPVSIEQHCRDVYEQLHPNKPFVYAEFREWTREMDINQANLA